jgi:hypothetical protein
VSAKGEVMLFASKALLAAGFAAMLLLMLQPS